MRPGNHPSSELLQQAAEALAVNGPFGALGHEAFDLLLAGAVAERLNAGQALFRQGDPGLCCYVVVSGSFDVVVDLGLGKVTMAVLGQGQLIGQVAVFTGHARNADVVAREESEVLRIDRPQLMALVAERPMAAIALVADLGHRLTEANQPLAFLSLAVRALEQAEFDGSAIDALAAHAEKLGPFAQSLQQMIQQIHNKQARERDMAMAARIQQSLLPAPWVAQAGRPVAMHAFMRPAREVGGDLYDYFMIDDSHLAFVVADVSGKGVPAALFMVMFQTALRASAMPGTGAAQSLLRANAILAEGNDACMFVTAFFGILDLGSGRVSYVNAGHNPPYVVSRSGRRRVLPGGGISVGMTDQPTFTTHATDLEPGDTLFAFTDGITEAYSPEGELFGDERLEDLLERAGLETGHALVTRVVTAVDHHANGAEQSDDITALALVYGV